MKVPICQICKQAYDVNLRIPMLLTCCHTICNVCVNSLTDDKCPFCKELFRKPDLKRNFALAEFVEEIRAESSVNQSQARRQTTNIEDSGIRERTRPIEQIESAQQRMQGYSGFIRDFRLEPRNDPEEWEEIDYNLQLQLQEQELRKAQEEERRRMEEIERREAEIERRENELEQIQRQYTMPSSNQSRNDSPLSYSLQQFEPCEEAQQRFRDGVVSPGPDNGITITIPDGRRQYVKDPRALKYFGHPVILASFQLATK